MSIATMFKKTAATALAVGIIAATNPGTALAWGHTAADKTRNIGALTGVVIAARVLYLYAAQHRLASPIMFVSSNNLSAWFQVAGAWIPSHPSPESADRVITCGFSQLQRIGGGAQINMWLPKTRNTPSITPNVPLQWAAIRQVEILFEGSHLELFDMDMDEFKRSLRFFNACRAGGQRLAVVIGGIYK
ncbi:MAG: hypothetical protein ABL897_15200, partial [Hyphomicrobium sp.]